MPRRASRPAGRRLRPQPRSAKAMIPFIIRRLLWMVVLLLVDQLPDLRDLLHAAGGRPGALRAGRQPTPELWPRSASTLGLDKPWYIQYLKYSGAARLPLRLRLQLPEQRLGQAQIFDRLPATDGAGGRRRRRVAAGRHPDRDHLRHQARHGGWTAWPWARALVAISAPVYWLGLVSLYLFSKDLGKFPLFEGQGAYPHERQHLHRSRRGGPGADHAVVVLAASFAAIYARFLRGNLLETMAEDYIRTARAKGLRERTRRLQARRALGDHADRHHPRPRPRHPARRRDPHRDRLQHPRRRPPGLRRHPEERPADRAGHGAHGRLLHHLPEPDRGHRLRLPRPARAGTELWPSWRSRTSRSTSTPTTASSRPSTASPTRSTAARRSASSASRARARASRR